MRAIITPAEFQRARQEYGNQETAAAALGVTVRQVRRWEKGEARVPPAYYRLIRILNGDLGAVFDTWRGWHLAADRLNPPHGRPYPRTWFDELHFHFQKLRDERAQMMETIRQLKQAARLPHRAACHPVSSTRRKAG